MSAGASGLPSKTRTSTAQLSVLIECKRDNSVVTQLKKYRREEREDRKKYLKKDRHEQKERKKKTTKEVLEARQKRKKRNKERQNERFK